MEVNGGAEEGFVREWAPCSHILNLIPTRIQAGLFSTELCLTCVDVVNEFIALGTNLGLVYWYDRKKGNIQRLRCEATATPITYVKIVNTVDYMVGAGNTDGQVTVFQIPKEHPENIPDSLKPKVEPKVERYTIGDLHKSPITAIEWSKNGMRLFSGDKNGLIIMTEIDFYMHLCKSMEIVNEEYEIVQVSYHQNILLVSSVYRSIVCERRDNKWQVTQLGTKERNTLCAVGGVVCGSEVWSARRGLRLWRARPQGTVLQTLLFKEAIANPLTVVELLNPRPQRHDASARDYNLGRLHVFREHFLVAHNEHFLYILDPRSLTAVAVVDDLRRILSVSVNKDEMFILEGPRSLVRLAHAPERATTTDAINLMTKSLTTSIQQVVNTVRDNFDQTVPYITSVLEQPLTIFSKTEPVETGIIVSGEECFELPPIKHLPTDISENVLESIINEFKDVSDIEEIRRIKSEELQKKLKLYNSIMEKQYSVELIHSSKRKAGSGSSTPKRVVPKQKEDVSYTSPCLMNLSTYSNLQEPNDDLLEKEIEEKEKILAKMLNLESLSITTPKVETKKQETIFTFQTNDRENQLQLPESPKPIKKTIKVEKEVKIESKPIDFVPKLVKLPNNWNLDNLELKLDIQANNNTFYASIGSPDDSFEKDWEII